MSNSNGIWNLSIKNPPPLPDDAVSWPTFESVADLRRALAEYAVHPQSESGRLLGLMQMLDANLDLHSILPKGTVEAWAQLVRSSVPREVTKANKAPRLSSTDTVKLAQAIVKERGELPKIDDELIPLLVLRGATHRDARKAATKVREDHSIKRGRRPMA